MGKLILHVGVAAFLVAVARGFSLGWVYTGAIVVAGVVAVHLVWERLFASPFDHLGSMPIANDDPLMLAAIEKAKESWPQFLSIYPDHKEDSIVKFRLRTTDGEIENVWGDLLELGADTADVYLRTPPVGEVDIPDRRMTVPRDDIIDWQVEYHDGTLRGGFSLQATYRIFEREEGHLPPEFLEQLGRYRDLDERGGLDLAGKGSARID